jgi:DNA-binding transcriptional LysR family regulator
MSLPPGTPDLAELDLLVTTAETGSLGAAARRHAISQPAASLRISALERRLGLVLLERGPTGSRLTVAGRAVVEWAHPVLDAAHALVGGAAALRADQRQRLRVAASLTIADHRVPGWLVRLRNREPDTSVALRVGNSSQVVELVRAGEVDLGFVEGPHVPPDLRSRAVGGDELVVVVGPGHPWARRRRPIPARQLAATPLILREPGSGTREAATEFLRTATGARPARPDEPAGRAAHTRDPAGRGAEPAPPAAELGSTAAIKAAAMAGSAPAVLSRLAVAGELADHRLVEVAVAGSEGLARRFRAVWLPDHPPSGAAALLLTLATQR